jgi:ribose transport system substrate-binding protein
MTNTPFPVPTNLDRRSLLRAAGLTGAAVAGVGALAACTNHTTGTTVAAAGVKNAPKTGNGSYVEVCAYNSAPYFYDHKLGMDIAGQLLGVKTEFTGPDQFDLPAMVNTLEQKVAEGPSGILVVGFDPSLNPGIAKAIAKGIPVVTVDADLPTSQRMAFLGTGNRNAGIAGGNKLADAIGKPGKVLLLTITGQTNLTDRVDGYKSALEAKGYQVVQVANTDGDPTKAASAVTAALATNPDLAGVGCVEAGGGRGAATALREANKAGQVKVVSMDRDPETLTAIQAGEIQASVAQKTAMMTFLGTLMLWQYQNVGVPITNDNKAAGITQFPQMVDTGAELITKANVAAWTRK